MLQICKEKWNKNQNKLQDYLETAEIKSYKDLVKASIGIILNDVPNHYIWDVEEITEIDNGDYQGTLLYLIPKNCYQPNCMDYLMTYTSYGSCSCCDTLRYIQEMKNNEERTKQYTYLCKNIISNIIIPYNREELIAKW